MSRNPQVVADRTTFRKRNRCQSRLGPNRAVTTIFAESPGRPLTDGEKQDHIGEKLENATGEARSTRDQFPRRRSLRQKDSWFTRLATRVGAGAGRRSSADAEERTLFVKMVRPGMAGVAMKRPRRNGIQVVWLADRIAGTRAVSREGSERSLFKDEKSRGGVVSLTLRPQDGRKAFDAMRRSLKRSGSGEASPRCVGGRINVNFRTIQDRACRSPSAVQPLSGPRESTATVQGRAFRLIPEEGSGLCIPWKSR